MTEKSFAGPSMRKRTLKEKPKCKSLCDLASNISANWGPKPHRLELLCRADLYKRIKRSVSLPCPFNMAFSYKELTLFSNKCTAQ